MLRAKGLKAPASFKSCSFLCPRLSPPALAIRAVSSLRKAIKMFERRKAVRLTLRARLNSNSSWAR